MNTLWNRAEAQITYQKQNEQVHWSSRHITYFRRTQSNRPLLMKLKVKLWKWTSTYLMKKTMRLMRSILNHERWTLMSRWLSVVTSCKDLLGLKSHLTDWRNEDSRYEIHRNISRKQFRLRMQLSFLIQLLRVAFILPKSENQKLWNRKV